MDEQEKAPEIKLTPEKKEEMKATHIANVKKYTDGYLLRIDDIKKKYQKDVAQAEADYAKELERQAKNQERLFAKIDSM